MKKPVSQAEKNVREYLARIGQRGGKSSRRELTKSHARQMVAIREAKRAAIKAGKPLSALGRTPLTTRKDQPASRRLPGIRKTTPLSWGLFSKAS